MNVLNSRCILFRAESLLLQNYRDETHFPGFQIQHSPLHHDASLGGKANSEASESGHTEHKR